MVVYTLNGNPWGGSFILEALMELVGMLWLQKVVMVLLSVEKD